MKITNSFLHLFSRIFLFVWVAFITLPGMANEEVWGLDVLMHRLSEVKRARLVFVETKQSAFLVTDVTLEGEMEYRAPDFIEKITVSPFFEKIIINGDSIVIEKTVEVGDRGDIRQTRRYSLKSQPLLKAAVESIRAMLAGNFELLTDNYIPLLDGGRDAWQLNLTPKSTEILDYIEQINLTGTDTEIREVVTIQADGDESRMKLTYQLLE